MKQSTQSVDEIMNSSTTTLPPKGQCLFGVSGNSRRHYSQQGTMHKLR
jgi:hypothetical protein